MRIALACAQAAGLAGEVPIGAVVTQAGKVIATGENRNRRDNDSTAHAEMVAIRAACAALEQERLTGCDLWVTLEPCPMCAAAISFARIRRLVFGALDPKSGGVLSGPCLYTHPQLHHKPEVTSELLAQDCGQILKDFFGLKRKTVK